MLKREFHRVNGMTIIEISFLLDIILHFDGETLKVRYRAFVIARSIYRLDDYIVEIPLAWEIAEMTKEIRKKKRYYTLTTLVTNYDIIHRLAVTAVSSERCPVAKIPARHSSRENLKCGMHNIRDVTFFTP